MRGINQLSRSLHLFHIEAEGYLRDKRATASDSKFIINPLEHGPHGFISVFHFTSLIASGQTTAEYNITRQTV